MMKPLESWEIHEFLNQMQRIPKYNRHPSFTDLAEHSGLSLGYLTNLWYLNSRISRTNRYILSRSIRYFGKPKAINRNAYHKKRFVRQERWHTRIEVKLDTIAEMLKELQASLPKK